SHLKKSQCRLIVSANSLYERKKWIDGRRDNAPSSGSTRARRALDVSAAAQEASPGRCDCRIGNRFFGRRFLRELRLKTLRELARTPFAASSSYTLTGGRAQQSSANGAGTRSPASGLSRSAVHSGGHSGKTKP